MPVGQQFSDWNSIDTSQPGLLGAVAAYGVDKSGLGNYLNSKRTQTQPTVGIAPNFAESYQQRQGVAPTGFQPAPPTAPIQANEQQQIQQDNDDDNIAKGMLNVSGWSGDEFGTGGQEKMASLFKMFG